MFYLIEKTYSGPNTEDHLNDDTVYITTECGKKNLSHEECSDGWLGQTGDWSKTAYGEFETYEEAVAEMNKLFDVQDPILEDNETNEYDDFEAYEKSEQEEPFIRVWMNRVMPSLNASETSDYMADSDCAITAETTDAELDAELQKCVRWSEDEKGYSLDEEEARACLENKRQEAIDEKKEEAEEQWQNENEEEYWADDSCKTWEEFYVKKGVKF